MKPTFRTAHIVYFSGTGGTARVAVQLSQALQSRGVTITMTELNHQPSPAAKADLLVMLYPVYASNAPVTVAEWIAAAPEGNGAKAAVLSVSGAGEVFPNTACRLSTIRALAKKGYDVFYENMFVMPSNFIVPYGDELAVTLLRAVPRKADAVAAALLAGKTRRTHPSLGNRLFTQVFKIEKVGSKWFGRSLKADSRCINCGWCAKHCPRGNITMREGKPTFDSRCVLCMRCVYGCPQKAIVPGLMRSAVLKQGFDLTALEERMQATVSLPPAEQLTKGKMYAGVLDYLTKDE
jgi:ferredoxin/flavodoxin